MGGMIVREHNLVAIFAALVFGFAAMPAVAQPTPNEAVKSRAAETPGQVERVRRVKELNAEADALPAIEFSDVLAAPDDPAVNLRYAREMIKQGRLQQAAATIERILILYPEADDVRLLYAILLYRMDVSDDALTQLDVLEARNPTDAIKDKIAQYRKLIAKRVNPLKRSASFAAGMHYDENRNAYPDSGKFLVGGVPVPGGSEEIDDWGRFAIGSAQFSRDTGKQQLQQVFADAAVMYDDQVEVDLVDVQALLINTGLLYKSAIGDFLPGAHASVIDLNSDRYLRDYALSLRWQKPLFDAAINGFAEARHGWRAYNRTQATPFADEQDGHYQKLTAGARKLFGPTAWLNASVALNRVDAAQEFESYRSVEASVEFTKVLPRSTFVTLSANLERQVYRGPLMFVSNRTRKDTDTSVEATYGVPLGTLAGLAFGDGAGPKPLRAIVLNLSASYQNSDSNLPNYEYDNYRGQFMLSRSWDF